MCVCVRVFFFSIHFLFSFVCCFFLSLDLFVNASSSIPVDWSMFNSHTYKNYGQFWRFSTQWKLFTWKGNILFISLFSHESCERKKKIKLIYSTDFSNRLCLLPLVHHNNKKQNDSDLRDDIFDLMHVTGENGLKKGQFHDINQ